MSKFRNTTTGVVVSVADEKDARFGDGWEPADAAPAKTSTKSASKKSES